jgi:hypothetical protein
MCRGISMKPHPRIRKTIKWGGAAVTLLLAVVWIGSGWVELDWGLPNSQHYALSVGVFSLWGPGGSSGGFDVGTHPFELRWWPQRLANPGFRILNLPLWPLAVAFAAAQCTVWRLDVQARRRERALLNLCPKCNYDRAGIAADAVCPECGSVGGAGKPA